ncbi:hypothetical protein EDB83DRAFT_487186 [Lactarius deliciosus]|nr:hypothetical protein EDB83DRAFT_487186 [Lactarius deliciosus]
MSRSRACECDATMSGLTRSTRARCPLSASSLCLDFGHSSLELFGLPVFCCPLHSQSQVSGREASCYDVLYNTSDLTNAICPLAMLSPLRLPSLSTPATPPSMPTLTQSSRSPASSYFRSMPQRASIRQFTRTVTYASIARLSSDITSATRRMLSPTPPRGNTKENATVWSPAVAMPITPRKGLPGPLWVTLSKARRTPDTPRKGSHHATFAYGLPSPISPPTRRLRPSVVRISRLPIPPFAVSTPPRRANPASRANGNHIVTPSSECYPTTPTSGRGIQYPRSSPRSPLSRKSSSIELDIVKNHCNEEEPLLSAFRGVSFSLSPSCSFSGIDNGLESLFSSTVLQLYVAGRDVPTLFSTTSPLAKMVQQNL